MTKGDNCYEIIAMNKTGQKPETLEASKTTEKKPVSDFHNVVGQDSLTRFDKKKKPTNNENKNRHKHKKNDNRPIILKKKNTDNNE